MTYLIVLLAVPCLVVAVIVTAVFVVYEARHETPEPRPFDPPLRLMLHELPLQAMFDAVRGSDRPVAGT